MDTQGREALPGRYRTRQAWMPAACAAFLSLSAYAQPELLQLAHYHPPRLEEIIVTSTREGRLRQHLPESVGVLDQTALEQITPAHPADALNRLAGVHINHLGGEGHMTAIRQPLTTGGVYLFLEDGIPHIQMLLNLAE